MDFTGTNETNAMVLQNYQNFIETNSNMIYIVALAVGFKCPRKIHLNTQCGGGDKNLPKLEMDSNKKLNVM